MKTRSGREGAAFPEKGRLYKEVARMRGADLLFALPGRAFWAGLRMWSCEVRSLGVRFVWQQHSGYGQHMGRLSAWEGSVVF